MDGAIALAKRVYSEDKSGSHRYDYEWLVDVVNKVSYAKLNLTREDTCLSCLSGFPGAARPGHPPCQLMQA